MPYYQIREKGEDMKKRLLLSTISVVAATLIVGCGGDSDTPSIAQESLTGQFVDAPVANLEYESSSGIVSTTDENGYFKYHQGDRVKFRIGKLILGETTPTEPIVTPAHLSEDNESLVLMLQLLQALDEDNNISNGITIPQEVVEALENKEQEILIEELDANELLSLDEKIKEHLDEDGDGEIDIDPVRAQNHFKSSLDKIKHQNGSKDSHGQNGKADQNMTGAVVDVYSYDKYELNQAVKDSLAYMGNEERLAYDTYSYLYEYHLKNSNYEIKQLNNIAQKSETRHVATVRDLVRKYEITPDQLTILTTTPVASADTPQETLPRGQYDIAHIQELYNQLTQMGEASIEDALKVGCIIEVTDVIDLDEHIKKAEEINAKDVVDAFKALRDGSYNHYWGFDKGLKNLGVEEGCCALGEIDGINYCHPEYPQNEMDNHNENNSTTPHGPKDNNSKGKHS